MSVSEEARTLPNPDRAAPQSRPASSSILTRLFDIAFAIALLTLTSPLLAIAMLAIRIESPGPALFRQTRMGRNGRTFRLVKLRGMYVDAPDRFPELYDYSRAASANGNGFYFHQPKDPRVTRVGRLLRKYSIDELPNFWNVLRGEMSVVGPRPEIPELAYAYGDDLPRLLSVRPGVTSPAKARGRDALSLEETIASDLEYIEHRSFRRDLTTIAQTVRNAFRGYGVS
jgi:lipopolysaccharide/colanic/teichoic acid biosynthesis glycosyltransferase